jgi:hypothetical protein
MVFKKTITSSLFLMVLATSLSAASFSIQSGTASIITPAPAEIIGGSSSTYSSDTILYAFDEKQNVTLSSILNLDQVNPPTGTFDNIPLLPGTLSVSAIVNSHFFLAEPSTNSGLKNYQASFLFDNPIVMIGFISSNGNLSSSESELGLTGVTYNYNGLTFNGSTDSVTVSADRKTLSLNFNVSNGTDFDTLRVITQTPEPETYLLMGGMVAALALLSHFKRKRA